MSAATPDRQNSLIEEMKLAYIDMFDELTPEIEAAIDTRVRVGAYSGPGVRIETPDRVTQVLERLGWPI